MTHCVDHFPHHCTCIVIHVVTTLKMCMVYKLNNKEACLRFTCYQLHSVISTCKGNDPQISEGKHCIMNGLIGSRHWQYLVQHRQIYSIHSIRMHDFRNGVISS